MKKLISLVLAIVLVLGICTVTFAGEKYVDYAFDRSWPEDELVIGVETFNVTDEVWLGVKAYYDHLAEIFNIKFIYSESITSPEQEFAFLDSCAAAGAKGIYGYYCAAGASAIMYAASLGMYYTGTSLDYYNKFLDEPYFVGGYSLLDTTGLTGEYLAGYEVGYALANTEGVTHIVYGSGETKVGMFKERQEGFFDGVAKAQEEGATVVFNPEEDVIGGWPDAPTFAPLQSAALTSDYDAVGSATDLAYWFQPVADSGKSIKMAAIGAVTPTYKTYFDNGTISAIVCYSTEYVFGVNMAMLINSCTGHEELSKNADGTPGLQHVYGWTINSSEMFNAIYDKHEAGEYFVSDEEFASVLGGLNPDASIDLIANIYDVTFEEALAK